MTYCCCLKTIDEDNDEDKDEDNDPIEELELIEHKNLNHINAMHNSFKKKQRINKIYKDMTVSIPKYDKNNQTPPNNEK